QMEVDLGGVDVRMAQQRLDGVQAGAGLDEMSGKALAQGVHGGVGQVEFLACVQQEALQAADGHRLGGAVHAGSQDGQVIVAAADVGEEQQRVSMKGP